MMTRTRIRPIPGHPQPLQAAPRSEATHQPITGSPEQHRHSTRRPRRPPRSLSRTTRYPFQQRRSRRRPRKPAASGTASGPPGIGSWTWTRPVSSRPGARRESGPPVLRSSSLRGRAAGSRRRPSVPGGGPRGSRGPRGGQRTARGRQGGGPAGRGGQWNDLVSRREAELVRLPRGRVSASAEPAEPPAEVREAREVREVDSGRPAGARAAAPRGAAAQWNDLVSRREAELVRLPRGRVSASAEPAGRRRSARLARSARWTADGPRAPGRRPRGARRPSGMTW